MKQRWLSVPVLSLYLAALTVSAQQQQTDPVGWWRVTAETSRGENTTTIRLDYFGGELSGSFTNSFIDAQLPIFDASLEGNNVAFKVQLINALMQYEGEINGDELELSSRVIEGEIPGVPEITTMTLTRSD